jgi:hypothetical protein
MAVTPGNPKVSRRLAAILAADIAGYSALICANEEATPSSNIYHVGSAIRPDLDGRTRGSPVRWGP